VLFGSENYDLEDIALATKKFCNTVQLPTLHNKYNCNETMY